MAKYSVPDFLQATKVLETLAEDRTLLTTMNAEDRQALLMAAGRVSRPTRHEQMREAKAFRRVARKEQQVSDRSVRATTGIRLARTATVFVAPPLLSATEIASAQAADVPAAAVLGAGEPARELSKPRACYICKEKYQRVHFFYDSMCPACAELNYQKRGQTAPLHGQVALITGARIKIGYQAALMMLRAGARVLVTTRFPRDAAARFAREADFDSFSARLRVYGLDLRHSPSVELFARYLTRTEQRLDIIINNAAQTVRRPPGFYAHMLDLEREPHAALSPAMQAILADHEECKAALPGGEATASDVTSTGIVGFRGTSPALGIHESATLSQISSAYDDVGPDDELFPKGQADADLQQVDLRAINSWRLTLADVPSPEMLEVQLVNAVAPFILVSKLKPLMMRNRTDQKHIVNVSAIEGQFARWTKTDKHPHTNMAKAALNMMTFTSAPDYAACGIFMNAVDTGWVTDEDPAAISERKRDVHDFQPPLDIVDGAARICDPFFSGILTGMHMYGKFLKDYVPVAW
jgi:NAD(P)-dependent dehydrogenase (short-subunit alcohol dehydrogenase family)